MCRKSTNPHFFFLSPTWFQVQSFKSIRALTEAREVAEFRGAFALPVAQSALHPCSLYGREARWCLSSAAVMSMGDGGVQRLPKLRRLLLEGAPLRRRGVLELLRQRLGTRQHRLHRPGQMAVVRFAASCAPHRQSTMGPQTLLVQGRAGR